MRTSSLLAPYGPLLAGLVLLVPAPTPVSGDGANERDQARLAEVETLLSESKPTLAFETAQRALEDSADNPVLLDAAARAAMALGKFDEALWYTRLGRRALPEELDRDAKPLAEALDERIAELDSTEGEIGVALDEYADRIFRLGQAAAKRGLWANAVDLYLRVEGTAFEDRAEKQLESIFKKEKTAQAIVDSGLPIPAVEVGKSESAIAAYDRKHSAWEKAVKSREFYTKQYKVHTDMGWKMGMAISRTMEQLNKHLRVVYQHKLSGKPLRDCRVDVFASVDEWREVEEPKVGTLSQGVLGFFAPFDNRISTYDLAAAGWGADQLWGTLFHEGSHQFADDVSKNPVPTWVDEGVACYMEGSRLMPNGVMVANLVPDSRIRSLVGMIGWKPEEGTQSRPSTKDLTYAFDVRKDFLKHIAPGSYDGFLYPWGWGFVYFIRNYEDEEGNLVYERIFSDFVDSYDGGGKHDVLDRWDEYFIEKAALPGIEDFDDWYAMWAAWILDLWEIHSGGPEQAEVLCQRGERQLSLDKPERAFESFSWALRKKADDPRAMWGLAQTKQAMKQDDGAVYFLRQCLAWCDAQADPEAEVPGMDTTVGELRAESLSQLESIYANLVEGAGEAEQAFRARVLEIADEYVEAGQPINAAQALSDVMRVIGPVYELASRVRDLQHEGGFDLRRPRRLQADADLSQWLPGRYKKRFSKKDDGIQVEANPDFSYLTYAETPVGPFRFEGKATFVKDGRGEEFIGFTFGQNLGGRKVVGWRASGAFGVLEFGEEGVKLAEELDTLYLGKGDSFTFAMEVLPGEVEFFVDSESVGKLPFHPAEVEGRVGLVASSAGVLWEDLRLWY